MKDHVSSYFAVYTYCLQQVLMDTVAFSSLKKRLIRFWFYPHLGDHMYIRYPDASRNHEMSLAFILQVRTSMCYSKNGTVVIPPVRSLQTLLEVL